MMVFDKKNKKCFMMSLEPWVVVDFKYNKISVMKIELIEEIIYIYNLFFVFIYSTYLSYKLYYSLI